MSEVLGNIYGKVKTKEFKFKVENNVKKFDYIKINHDFYGDVLCQIVELERDTKKTLAKCNVIGYKDEQGRVRSIRQPFVPGDDVYLASDDFIKEIISLDTDNGAYIGKLDGKDIKIHLDLEDMLTKHVSILAKTGAGKSYTVGVLLEEIAEKKVPVIILDPHGEYTSLKYPNDNKEEKELMDSFGISPKGYLNSVVEFGDVKVNKTSRPLKLNEEFSAQDLMDILPTRLTNTQKSLLFSAVKNVEKLTFSNLIYELEAEDSNTKWTLINLLKRMASLDFFSLDYTPLNELVQSNRVSVINLRGIPPEIQDVLMYKMLKDLFHARKINKIPPFFMVVEEAHNFAPEKGFGKKKTSAVLRNIASEGRKFGLGLCVITQRPARVEKSVLSQCTTNIVLKVTNPNDLKAVSKSVEGLTSEAEKEIKNIPVGTALVSGIVDMPLFVNIRPRKTNHGGRSIDVLGGGDSNDDEDESFFEKKEDFEKQDMKPLIYPNVTKKDLKLMSVEKLKKIETHLHPAFIFSCESNDKKFKLLVEMVKGNIIVDIDEFETKILPSIDSLNSSEIKVLEKAYELSEFSFEDFTSKSGFGFDSKEILNSLCKKDFLNKNKEDGFEVNSKIILSNLDEYSFHKDIEFKSINYDLELDSKVSVDDIKDELENFVSVKDTKEGFIVRYIPIKTEE
ncbi:MAG: ATP-binding protein [Candidatus Woesearchaeota archaeon]